MVKGEQGDQVAVMGCPPPGRGRLQSERRAGRRGGPGLRDTRHQARLHHRPRIPARHGTQVTSHLELV